MSKFNHVLFSKALKESGLKDNFVAKKMGVSRITITAWKYGKVIPSMEHLNNISEMFKIEVSNLIEE